jgi:uncharacterized membrane protein
MNRLIDLRFVIGLFFLVVGIILLTYSFITAVENAVSINRWCGIVFIVFGVFMLALSFKKDESDDVLL